MTDASTPEANADLCNRIAELIGDSGEHIWMDVGSGIYDGAEYCARCGESVFGDDLEQLKRDSGKCIRPYAFCWDAAMEAAGITGIFEHDATDSICLRQMREWWVIQRLIEVDVGEDETGEVLMSNKSGPLLICWAILRFYTKP